MKHGTTTDYRKGCRCDLCRRACADAMARRRKRAYLARTDKLSVPSLGTQRRIQALVALGWSLSAISRRAGYTRSHCALILNRAGNLQRATADRIAAVYDELSMTLPPETTKVEKIDASRARNYARSKGWLPPLAWDDIDSDADIPGDEASEDKRDTIDEVAVQRLVTGDFNLSRTLTVAERKAVIIAWRKSGRSLRELGVHTGWKVDRYVEDVA